MPNSQFPIPNYQLPITKTMRLPTLAAPVKRFDVTQGTIKPDDPESIYIYPHRAVDVTQGTTADLVAIRIDLLHGANFNDPAAYRHRSPHSFKTSCGYGCFRY
jgi:cyanobactin biosynthesis protein (PatB/AcyB/McaB family)